MDIIHSPSDDNSDVIMMYTDGGCHNTGDRKGDGSYAFLFRPRINTKFVYVYCEYIKDTTNNRMELTAIIEALRALKEGCKVILTSDSKYLVDAIEKGWLDSWKKNGWRKSDRSEVLNVDLWQRLIVQLEKHTVSFVWVHGHTGHEYNERCDVLATTFADSL